MVRSPRVAIRQRRKKSTTDLKFVAPMLFQKEKIVVAFIGFILTSNCVGSGQHVRNRNRTVRKDKTRREVIFCTFNASIYQQSARQAL